MNDLPNLKLENILKKKQKLENNYYKQEKNSENSMVIQTKTRVHHHDNKKRLSEITFVFKIINVDSDILENDEYNKDLIDEKEALGKLEINYLVKYSIDEKYFEKLDQILLTTIEPYFRLEVEKILTDLKLPSFILPFGFWKDENN